jgi:hypothetical protein
MMGVPMRENDLKLEEIVLTILVSAVLLLLVLRDTAPDKTSERLYNEFTKVCAEVKGVLVHTPDGGLKCLK